MDALPGCSLKKWVYLTHVSTCNNIVVRVLHRDHAQLHRMAAYISMFEGGGFTRLLAQAIRGQVSPSTARSRSESLVYWVTSRLRKRDLGAGCLLALHSKLGIAAVVKLTARFMKRSMLGCISRSFASAKGKLQVCYEQHGCQAGWSYKHGC